MDKDSKAAVPTVAIQSSETNDPWFKNPKKKHKSKGSSLGAKITKKRRGRRSSFNDENENRLSIDENSAWRNRSASLDLDTLPDGVIPTEENLENLSLKKLQKILIKLGTTLDRLLNEEEQLDKDDIILTNEYQKIKKEEEEVGIFTRDDDFIEVIQTPSAGSSFRLELGRKVALKHNNQVKADLERNDEYFLTYLTKFLPFETIDLLVLNQEFDQELEPIIITVKKENSEENTITALIRTKHKDNISTLHSEGKIEFKFQNIKKLVKENLTQFSKAKFFEVSPEKHLSLEDSLLSFEKSTVQLSHKFAVIYCKENQTEENEILSNAEGSEEFSRFLDFLGDTVELNGWNKYTGGLDVKYGSTGEKSVYTEWERLSIMFHVSTYLPHSVEDIQQLERKRHIGNDIVVLIFLEGENSWGGLEQVKSEFNHIFIVVRFDKKLSQEQGKSFYRVGCAYKKGVPPFKPVVPQPPIFESGDIFRNWLFSKMINAERAALSAPVFTEKTLQARYNLLNMIISERTGGSHSKWKMKKFKKG